MTLNQRTIKLGRLFMVAFLLFYALPIATILTKPFAAMDRVIAMSFIVVIVLWSFIHSSV